MNPAIGRLALPPMNAKAPDIEGVFRGFRECLNTFDEWAESFWGLQGQQRQAIAIRFLNKALTRDSCGLDSFNGKDHNQNPTLKLELPGAGRGYRLNKKIMITRTVIKPELIPSKV
ncbi:hypothetical protein GIW50_17580 [Pseudomonas syringae]|uniref:Uncharacterized protein n=1 Tax=Pseudomonas syringae TaxID=317 RepID=A0A9Q3X7T2_PSESX|nr:hypothetical protein [Pseudomonas syringae]MCF5065390.1 hypothetical protein [Pseudomonas syringae]MCF5074537.1 hypothetical protein [Pseudomonas syringae]MCF5120199.1 hypothetical protein [Pseudomonas syringae]MCF5381128.1 hypothetical protein [Pseudomonas syringae]